MPGARVTSSAGARILPALAYVTLVLAPGLPATAVELLQGRVGAITAEDWRISGLSFSIDTGEAVRKVLVESSESNTPGY